MQGGKEMKTAIYIEDGTVQLVITPESDFEKNALSGLKGNLIEVKLFNGSFYDCRGGWIRQSKQTPELYGVPRSNEDNSLILRISDKIKETPQ